jgi:hypothetical protein
MLRNGLSYSQASRNCKAIAEDAYKGALAEGRTIEESEAIAFAAYESEMAWYEGH